MVAWQIMKKEKEKGVGDDILALNMILVVKAGVMKLS